MADAALVLLGGCVGTAIWWLAAGHEMPLRRSRREDERWRRLELGWAKHFARNDLHYPPADPRWPMFHLFRRGGRHPEHDKAAGQHPRPTNRLRRGGRR